MDVGTSANIAEDFIYSQTYLDLRNIRPVIDIEMLYYSIQVRYICINSMGMKKAFFRFLAKVNKAILPSYSKKGLDLAKASKLQMALIGWRYYVTKNALG